MTKTLNQMWHEKHIFDEKLANKCFEAQEKTRVTKKYRDKDGFMIICSQYTHFRQNGIGSLNIAPSHKVYKIEVLDNEGNRLAADTIEADTEKANNLFKEYYAMLNY